MRPGVAMDPRAGRVFERCPAKPVHPLIVVADAQAVEASLTFDVSAERYKGFQDFFAAAKAITVLCVHLFSLPRFEVDSIH
jgi:hypothetical protein